MSNLKLFRLNNGDDIIGFLEIYSDHDIDDDNEESQDQEPRKFEHIIFVRDPMRIIWSYDTKTKGHQLYLTHWMPFSNDQLFAIPKDKIITICEPMPEVEKHYNDVNGDEQITIDNPNNDEKILTKEEQEDLLYLDWLEEWDVKDEKEH